MWFLFSQAGLVNRQRMSKQIIAKTNVYGIHDLETI